MGGQSGGRSKVGMIPLQLFYLKKLLTALCLPPIAPILLLLMSAWVLIHQRKRLAAAIAAGALLYWYILITPATISVMLQPLRWQAGLDLRSAKDARAVVVLSAGRRRTRLAGNISKSTGLPLLITGGSPWGGEPEAVEMAKQVIAEQGFNPKWIETKANDTFENANFSAAILRNAHIGHIILVTDFMHMHRACEEFRRANIVVTPAASLPDMVSMVDPHDWIPNPARGELGTYVAHEWLGLLVQRMRGYGNQCIQR